MLVLILEIDQIMKMKFEEVKENEKKFFSSFLSMCISTYTTGAEIGGN